MNRKIRQKEEEEKTKRYRDIYMRLGVLSKRDAEQSHNDDISISKTGLFGCRTQMK